ncbi:MAG TPA: DUF5818 domain-containing protein [Candidatus Acidoferrales bacterium]|jgi:hypothetical protein|nr:DUF5818 domain-containing protein [Candidatus Acidoferrales bacterium]
MNRTSVFLNVAMMTVVCGAVTPLANLDSQHAIAAPTQQSTIQAQQNDKADTKVFTGTIWMNGDRFVLRDERKKVWYHLDVDRKAVAGFEGKQVKVIGTLDAANSEIHVQHIEEA